MPPDLLLGIHLSSLFSRKFLASRKPLLVANGSLEAPGVSLRICARVRKHVLSMIRTRGGNEPSSDKGLASFNTDTVPLRWQTKQSRKYNRYTCVLSSLTNLPIPWNLRTQNRLHSPLASLPDTAEQHNGSSSRSSHIQLSKKTHVTQQEYNLTTQQQRHIKITAHVRSKAACLVASWHSHPDL